MQPRYGHHHHYWLWMFSRLPYGLRVVVMVFIAAWVALALHELAHALAARLLGVRIWSITLGRGPVLWEGFVGRCQVRIALLPLHGEVRLVDGDAERLGYRNLQASAWGFVWLAGSSWRAPIISGAGGIANLLGAKAVLLYWIAMPKLLPQLYSLSACIFVVNAIMFLNLAPIRGLDGWRLAVQTAAWRRAPRLQVP